MSDNEFEIAPGWYPDPGDTELNQPSERFWNGSSWTSETRKVGSGGQPYASWWARAGATLVDVLILIPILSVFAGGLYVVLFFVFFSEDLDSIVDSNGMFLAQSDSRFLVISFIVVLLSNAILFAYQVVNIGLWGKTVGDRAVGIRIASQHDGSKASWGQASRRTAVLCAFSLGTTLPVVGLLFYVLYITNFFSMLWDSQKRCWHDILGGTIVVKNK